MQQKGFSSLELTAIINELQSLVPGKIVQIYHQEKKELLFQLHLSGKVKCLLKIVPGKFFCLTEKKEAPLKPSSFCLQLRKYLNNAFIKAIYQKDAERIVVFEIEKEEKYFLIIELFSKGNLILTDKNYLVIGALEQQEWKERSTKIREGYVFPTPGFNWKAITELQLKKILSKSEKKNLATALALEIGLGGLYAEEVCKVSDIDFKKLPKEVKDTEIKQIVKTIKEFLTKIEEPKGYLYEGHMVPFPLVDLKPLLETKTFSEVVDKINPTEIISPYEKKIKTLQKMIAEQEEAVKKHAEKIELNKKKGELIYEKYVPLQKLLEIVKEMKKNKGWREIALELQKEKKIKKVDLKNKTVTIDL